MLGQKIDYLRQEFPNYYLFLIGHFNARTKDFLDYILSDNLNAIFNMDVDYDYDDFEFERNNKDKDAYNAFGKSLVELCTVNDIHLLNGLCMMILYEIVHV